ncbi:dihydrofolate reductase family protein [Nonomuraea cypriaca]|uniref:dihydrofolate reductase family protein n=1 Tax=Nonomuraea cypriaca TaxID=1187855 RepID=UPI001F40508A|nr:dihydrofolate reductase family protein [Nonomuraea cypriaca]
MGASREQGATSHEEDHRRTVHLTRRRRRGAGDLALSLHGRGDGPGRRRADPLKQRPGENIGVTGSSTLVVSLLRDGLLDELNLLVHPIVIGKGKKLFGDVSGQIPLTLTRSATFGTGVLNLTYTKA